MAAAVAMPAYAGSKGEKCTQDTQTCLNHFSAKKSKGWLGVDVDKQENGTQVVKKVVPGTAAEKAGLQVGDVLTARNGIKVSDYEALKADKDSWKIGAVVTYTILRAGKEQKIPVTLGTIPDDVFAAMVGAHMVSDHMATATMASTEGAKAEPVPAKAASKN
jgi:S1-C subfamily serine protease